MHVSDLRLQCILDQERLRSWLKEKLIELVTVTIG